MKARWLSLLLTVVLVGAAWFWLRPRGPDTSRGPAERPNLATSAPSEGTASTASRSASGETARTAAPAPSLPPESVTSAEVQARVEELRGFERLKFVRWLKQQKELNPPMPVRLFGPGDQLSPDFLEGFELNAAETARLQAALDRTRSETERFTTAYARSAWDEDRENWVVEIPAYPEEGRILYDDLFGEFSRVLTKEEWNVFQELFGSQLEGRFDHLGTREQRFVIARDATAAVGGRHYLKLRHEWKSGDSYGNTVSDIPVEEFARRWPALVEQLPPEIRQQLPP